MWSKQYFSLSGIQNGFHPKYGLAGSIEGAEVTASSSFLSSWSLIFTQPTLDVQPFREATKPFWEIWMECGSNLSPFFFQEQVWKSKFCKNKHLCYVIYFSHSFWMTLYVFDALPGLVLVILFKIFLAQLYVQIYLYFRVLYFCACQ